MCSWTQEIMGLVSDSTAPLRKVLTEIGHWFVFPDHPCLQKLHLYTLGSLKDHAE